MGDQRMWLDVPYGDKDEAKGLGARWDPDARRWYTNSAGAQRLSRWASLPEILPVWSGEDRAFGSGLFVDLVPDSCWFTNVRSCVRVRDWDRLRRMVRIRASGRCECCTWGSGTDAHERWAYDDARGVQVLRRLIWVCAPCHTVTHFGLAQIRGKETDAFTHLQLVTGMTAAEAAAHVEAAFAEWRRRSERIWQLDLSVLSSAGVSVTPPPAAQDRIHAAQAALRKRSGGIE